MSYPTGDPRPSQGTAQVGVAGPGNIAKGVASNRWSDGHPNLDERSVLSAIANADIRALVRSLDEGAFRRHHGSAGFTCPRCGFWSAEVVAPALWWCAGCDHSGTRYELAHIVACDPFAAVRLAQVTGVLR